MNRRSFLTAGVAASILGLLPFQGSARTLEGRRAVRAGDFYDRGRWVRGRWADLKRGTIFRVIDPTPDGGERIADQGTDHEVSIAVEDARQEPSPMFWGVKCEPFTFVTMDHPLAAHVRVIQEDGTQLGFVQEMNVPMGIAKLGEGQMCSGVHVEIDLS